MPRLATSWKGIWLLPIVFLIAIVMVVPAGAATQATASRGGSLAVAPTVGTAASAAPTASTGFAPSAFSANSAAPSSWGSLSGAHASSASNVEASAHYLASVGANPADVALLQSVASLLASGKVSPSAVQLPNFQIFSGAPASPAQVVSPGYSATPAPMGIADYGLGTVPYTLNTSGVSGTVTLNNYNATAAGFYEDSAPYWQNNTTENSPGNPYDSGIQLNTVLSNITYPYSYTATLGSGVFWTQNVLEFFGDHMQFVDNVWNWSAAGASMKNSTLFSYNGVLLNNDFYYDYGPKLPVSFPMTVQLYNNVSLTLKGQDVLTFGYRVTEGSKVYQGVYDTVVFNSPPGSTKTLHPAFRVDGNSSTPFSTHALFDSEMTFGGPAAGTNAVITNATGSMTLQYEKTPGTWTAVRSAYDFGSDTGETAIGVAETWSGTTVGLTAGPSFPYGLWGTTGGAPSGADAFVAHVTPIYGFVFLGEYDPTSLTNQNLTYAPTNAQGVVNTMLPPTLPAPFTGYGIEAFADEYSPIITPTVVTLPQSNYAVTLTASSGTLDAPLYMNGEAQATALETAITGTSTSPYTFKNLAIALDPTYGLAFNILNDYRYTPFSLFFSTGVTTSVVVDNVTQAPNLFGFITDYFYPYAGGFYGYHSENNYSQEFVDWGGSGDQFRNLTVYGYSWVGIYEEVGGAVYLWDTTNVVANNVTSLYGSPGVWASTSTGTTVKNSAAYYDGGAVFVDYASHNVVAWNLTSFEATAFVDEGGTGATASYLNATFYSYVVYFSWANSTTLSYVLAQYHSSGGSVYYGTGLGVSNLKVNDSSSGFYLWNASSTTVTNGSSANYSYSPMFEFVNGGGATLTDLSVNRSFGVLFEGNFTTGSVTDLVVSNEGEGAGFVQNATGVTISSVTVSTGSLGVFGESDWAGANTVSGVTVMGRRTTLTEGVFFDNVTGATVSGVQAWNYSRGAEIEDSRGDTVIGVSATNDSEGLYGYQSSRLTVTNSSASGGSMALYLYRVNGSKVTTVGAFNYSIAVAIEQSSATTLWGISDTNQTSVGADLYDSGAYFGIPYATIDSYLNAEMTITDVTSTNVPAALWDGFSNGMQVSHVNVTGAQYGLVLNGTSASLFSGINANQDWQGMVFEANASHNNVVASNFTDDTSFAVVFTSGGCYLCGQASFNTVWGNNFTNNNGATGGYSASHIQASSGNATNQFYVCSNTACTLGRGNYWSDWHTRQSNGAMAPYLVSGASEDLFPVGNWASTGQGNAYLPIGLGVAAGVIGVGSAVFLARRKPKGGTGSTAPAPWKEPPQNEGGAAPKS